MEGEKPGQALPESVKVQNVADDTKMNFMCIPIRVLVAFLAFIGFTFNYMLRVRITGSSPYMVIYNHSGTWIILIEYY